MKRLLLAAVRFYLRLGLFFYFRRIHVRGIENIPLNQPTLILCNHQNALLDALLIASNFRGYAHFLTRASVFKNSFVSRLLQALNLIPVYRIRDGWSQLSNNHSVFGQCTELLADARTVVIFPEGNHNLVRRVRPLSKGFTRIVFETLQRFPETKLQLLPAGVNFQSATECPDSAALHFGEPILASDFYSEGSGSDSESMKLVVHAAMSKLTTHIPEPDYDEILQKLESLQTDFTDPCAVNSVISDGSFSEKSGRKSKTPIRSLLRLLLKIWMLIPYLFWRHYVRPRVKEEEFISTFRFAIAITVVPLYLLVVFVLLLIFTSWPLAASWLVASLLIALLAIKL